MPLALKGTKRILENHVFFVLIVSIVGRMIQINYHANWAICNVSWHGKPKLYKTIYFKVYIIYLIFCLQGEDIFIHDYGILKSWLNIGRCKIVSILEKLISLWFKVSCEVYKICMQCTCANKTANALKQAMPKIWWVCTSF